MIITRTPFRISFVGGGSDLESFYSQHQGAVLSTTINKYMYLSSHNFFDTDKIRLKYSKTETASSHAEIQHPVFREVMKKFNVPGAVEISSNADVPSGTGLGSSSAFTVGLLHNLHSKGGRMVSKDQLAREASEIEIEKLKEPIGKQDQYAAAHGGLNVIKFNADGSVHVDPIHLRKEIYKGLQERLLMFYTGEQRDASSILTEQKANMAQTDKVGVLKEMVGLVDDLRDSLFTNNLHEFGQIMHKNWELKQKLASSISNPVIKDLYSKALSNGAVGGKLLGAGGGGFFLFYCEPEKQQQLRAAMQDLRELKFKFEHEGSKIVHVGDEY
tara:strand:- start:5364 stop:6350 length:987 start_codon:yes stop_codon:yes gene_type:complete